MGNLSFQYPIWLAIVCVLGACLYVGFLYWKSQPVEPGKPWLQPLLMLLRFLPILAIGLHLLGPLLKQIKEDSKQPSIVILSDNSLSVGNWLNQEKVTGLKDQLEVLESQLSEKYNVAAYTFGDEVKTQENDTILYDSDLTNISDALKYIVDIYEGENLGSIVLATDGIYNAGQNPLYTSLPVNIPIHSIALGDTSQRRDALVQTVLHNEVSYLNDEMLTQVDVRAINAANQTLKLTIERETTAGYVTVDTRNIVTIGNDFFTTEEVKLSFNQVGIQHYRFRISSLNNEINRSNNRKDIYIEVLDARQEIGIVAAAPHPDITALKQLLELNKNYQVNIFFENLTSSEISNLDLVMFHNLPSGGRNLRNIVNSLDNRKIPRIYILGGQTDFQQFNQIQNLATIKGKSGNTNNAQASIDRNFENFTLSEKLRTNLKRYPPLSAPFGEYDLNGNVKTLLYQSIGDITTDFPLVSFADIDGIKSTYIFGNDIWRWKLFDFLQNENFDLISELIDKTIVYTSTKEDKRKFRVNANSNVLLTNENVVFSAELYNNNYELINDPEVLLKLFSSEGNSFDYTFSKNAKSYLLDIGRLAPGAYSYKAETIFNGEQYMAEGRFVVKEIQFELYNLEAQHNLLYALADKTNGSVRFHQQVGALSTELLNAENIKPVIYQNVISKPLIDNRWLFLLLFLPLAMEWLLRRYFGSL